MRTSRPKRRSKSCTPTRSNACPVADKCGRLIGIITMQDILEKRQYPLATRDWKGNLQVAAAVGPLILPGRPFSMSVALTHWLSTVPTATI